MNLKEIYLEPLKIAAKVVVLWSMLCFFHSNDAKANHILGGNITWTCLGGNNYQITLTYYKDCYGNTGDPATENVTLLPVGACGGTQTSTDLDFVSVTEISDLCATELPNSSCSGGLNPGTQQVVYQGTITLTAGCTWRVVYNDQDWNYFNNMTVGSNDAFIYSEINTTACSNSVQLPSSLANPAIVYACFNAPFTHTLAVNNPNGYALTYTLVPTMTTGASVSSPPVTAPGYTTPSGVSFVGGTFNVPTINPANGFTFFGNYVFTVRIEMYNGATLMGVMYENITVVVRNCAPTTTVFTTPAVQAVGNETVQGGPASVSVCAGDTLTFDVEATNSDLFRSIDLTYSVSPALPGLTFAQNGLNPAIGTFSVNNTSASAGTYTLTVTATDDACPNPDTDQIVVTMVIHPNVSVNFTDTTICRNVNTAIVASGLSNVANYDWSVISGDLTPTPVDGSATLVVAPDSTTVYQVTGIGVPAQCTASQQITVHVALHNVTQVISGETCNLNNGSINITPVGDWAGVYNYAWVGPGVIAGVQDQSNLTGGNYSVTVTVPGLGCSINESYTVTDSPQPSATFTGSTTVCENGTANLTLTLTAGQMPYDFTISPALPPAITDGVNVSPYTFPVTVGTTNQTYTITSITDNSGCTAVTNYPVTVTVRPTVTATLVQPAPICAGDPLCLQVDFSHPGMYNVTYNSGGAPVVVSVLDLGCIPISPNLTATTIFDIDAVNHTTAPNCPSTDASNPPITVIVNPLPTVNLSGGSMTCPGATDQLTLTPLTGTGPWEVIISEEGVPMPAPIIIPAGSASFNFNVLPNSTGTTEYCVVSVEDINCLNANNSNLNQCTISTAVAPADATLTGSTTICEGGSATLTLTLTAGTAPMDFTISPAIAGSTVNVASPYSFTVTPASTTTYTVTSVSDNLNCPTTINTSATVTVLPLVTTTLQPVPPQCDNDPLVITVDHSAAGSYYVTYTVNGGAPITTPAPVADGGTITITPAPTASVVLDVDAVYYSGLPACPSSDANNGGLSVTVNDRPTATLTGGSVICVGGNDDMTLTLTGVGPWTVSYTLNGIPQADFVVANSPYTWNVTPATAGSYTYCITSVEDVNCTSAAIPAATGCTTVQAIAYPTLCNYAIDDLELCQGQCATMTITVCETGLWSVNCQQIPDNAAPESFVSQGSAIAPAVPFTYNICPTVTTDYVVTSIYFDGTPQCATTLNDTIRVNVNGIIQVAAPDTICDNIASSYTLEYTITGGEAPYDELPGGVGGSFAGNVFTSAVIPTGSGANFTFSDINDCNSVLMTMAPYTCPVLTEAGTMSNTTLQFCNTGAANGTYNNDGYLDGNDEQVWLLVTNPASPIATVVQTNCLAPQFNFSAGTMTYGTTYYIVSAVGDDFGDGECVDLTAPNVSFSNGQPTIWYATPTATLSTVDNTVCQGQCVTLDLNLTGNGPWTVVYSIDGINQLPALQIPTGTAMPYSWCVTVAGIYELESLTSGPLACTGTVAGSVNVIINPLPTATWSGSDETCQGIDHCFDIAFNAGTGPWDVEIDVPVGANVTMYDVATPYNYCSGVEGAYDIVSVVDANGCASTVNFAPVILTVHDLPTATWSLSDTSFCAGTSVHVESINTGEMPFSLFVTEPVGVNEIPNNWAGDALNFDEPGTYSIDSIIDGNGCVGVMNLDLTLTEISLPITDAGPDLEVCSGVDISIGTPAVAGQTYSWTPTTDMTGSLTAQPTINITSAAASTVYTYTVVANNQGCTVLDAMDLTVFAPPSFGIVASADSICFGGMATLTADSGPGYAWAWDPSPSITSGNLNAASIDVEPTTTETFEVTVSQTHTTAVCVDSLEYTIYVGDTIIVDEDFPEELCFGACDGEIELQIIGGFAPYTYGPASELTDDFTQNLCPDTYDYVINDAIGCEVTGQIIIEEREPEFIDSLVVTQPTCSYDTGSIEVFDNVTSINISSAPMECNINETVFGVEALFTGLTAPCTVTITSVFQVDGNPNAFCSTTEVIEIESISSDIDLNPAWTSGQFCYDEQVCFEANPTGGTGAPDVEWYNCPELTANCFVNTDSPFCFNIQSDSTLYGVAIDGLGCYSDTVMVEATLFPGIDLLVAGGADTLYLCEYDTLAIDAAVAGGNGLIQVDWYEVINDNAPLETNSTSIDVHPFYETAYYAIAADNCSEPQIDTVVVHVYDTPEVYFETDTLAGCYPITVNFYDLSLINPGINFDCEWAFGNGAESALCADTTTYTYPGFGDFYPTLTLTTEDGCEASYTAQEPIEVYGYPEIDFTWNPQPVTVLEHNIEFTNLTQGAEEYLWNFYGTATSVARNPTHDIGEPIDMGIYPICLIATTEHGCIDTLCQDILVESVLGVFVPNSFTPDGDGINDVFIPIVSGIKPDKFKFWVFNKWGDEIFFTDKIGQAWTGGSHNGEFYVSQDVYVWRIECEAMQDGRIEVFEGHVTILR